MKVSVLHVSDLHRDPSNPVRNDVLLDSLDSDRQHYSTEEESSIRSPDLIIVSGDIIQGIKPDAQDPDAQLREQYREALGFLGTLADRFVGGDRGRVVIVPGNHDNSAHHLAESLSRVSILTGRREDLARQLFQPHSRLRWSWSEFELYEIIDPTRYAQRLEAFAEFYADFYNRDRTYDLDPEKQIDVFDFPAFGITIAGFSSCYNNDLFNKQGAIHPGCMAFAGTKLREPLFKDRIRIAVWHHNTEGLPQHSDYMDPDFLQNLIDRGFSLGFHGHQHRPEFISTRFRHGPNRRITVISAGTLGSAAYFHSRRAYNIIELDTDNRTGRLHVREMKNENLDLPIWGRCHLPPYYSAYHDFDFDPPPEPACNTNVNTTRLKDAQRLYDSGDYRGASDILVAVAPVDALARPILLDCLVKLKDTSALIRHFDPPASNAEAIYVMDALWAEERHERLQQVLISPLIAESVDPSVTEVRKKYVWRLTK